MAIAAWRNLSPLSGPWGLEPACLSILTSCHLPSYPAAAGPLLLPVTFSQVRLGLQNQAGGTPMHFSSILVITVTKSPLYPAGFSSPTWKPRTVTSPSSRPSNQSVRPPPPSQPLSAPANPGERPPVVPTGLRCLSSAPAPAFCWAVTAPRTGRTPVSQQWARAPPLPPFPAHQLCPHLAPRFQGQLTATVAKYLVGSLLTGCALLQCN